MESRRILIVDPDTLTSSMLKTAFEKKGAVVDIVTDGHRVADAFRKGRYDMVVLDSLPPLHKGFDLCREMRKIKGGEGIPIVMTSVSSDVDGHRTKAAQAGATAFEGKPFSVTAFANRAMEVLEDRTRGHEEVSQPKVETASAPPKAEAPSPPPPPPSAPPRAESPPPRSSARSAPAAAISVEVDRDRLAAFKDRLREAGPDRPFLKGDLFETEAPSILTTFYLGFQANLLPEYAVLRASHDKKKKEIYFRQGQPIFVKSNLVSETLGRLLVELGKINRKQLEDSLLEMKRTGVRQGDVLVDLGYLTREELAEALVHQERVKINDLFSWEAGEFEAYWSLKAFEDVPEFRISFHQALLEGIRTAYNVTRLRRKLERYQDTVLVPNGSPLFEWKDVDLSEEEAAYVEGLTHGAMTVKTAWKSATLDEEKALPLLFALLVSGRHVPVEKPKTFLLEVEGAGGCLRFGGESEAAPPSSPPPPSRPVAPPPPPAPSRPVERGTPPPAPPPVTSADEAGATKTETEWMEQLRKMDAMNHYELLGIPNKAIGPEIKRVYFKLAKDYHPDKFFKCSPEVRKQADTVFAKIGEAYRTLTDPEARKAYDVYLETGKTQADVNEEVMRIMQAEDRFREGQQHLKRRAFREAVECFDWAIERNPDEAEYSAWLGWAKYNLDSKGNRAEAEKLLQRAIDKAPKSEEACYLMAQFHAKEGHLAEAVAMLKKCMAINKFHPQAETELKIFERRLSQQAQKKPEEKKTEEKKGLGKLFKR